MSNVGNYEILDELSLTRNGSVSRAKRADGEPGDFAVKRFHVQVDDPSEPHWELQTFLDRARVQQTLAGGGARHWAPIHDLGIEVDSAWYVTDYHPLTTQKLIDARISLRPENLHALILGILQGLSELKGLRNRPHGNLHARNVLIGGSDLQTAPVLLTDPATNGQAAKIGETGDLRSLGALIYAVVMHRLPPVDDGPIPASAQWSALGGKGDDWRGLCSDLLHAQPSARMTLAAVAQRMHTLRSRPKLRLRKFFAAAGVLALLGVLAVGTLSVYDHSARSQLDQARADWFEKFLDASANPVERKSWEADPDLHRLLAGIPLDDIRRIDSNTSRFVRWKYSDYVAVCDALLSVQKVQDELPLHWKKANRAMELRQRFDNRGWTQPAEYLAQLVDAVKPGPGKDLPAAIDRLLIVSPSVESSMGLADSDWKQFSDHIGTISAMRDPVLNKLAAVLKQSASSDVQLRDSGYTGLDDLKQDIDLAAQLTNAIHDTWPTNVDREPFDRDVAKAIDINNAKKEDITKWLGLVSYHAIRRDEAIAAADQLRKRLSETLDLISHAHVAADEVSSFKSLCDEANLAISDFEQTTFSRRTIDDGTFATKRNEVSNRIEGLRRFYHPEGPDEWLNALPAVATASDRINGYWEAWRKVLRDGLPDMIRDHAIFAARQEASEQLRALLVSLDQTFPPTPPMPNDAFTAAARLHREQSIEKLLPQIDLASPKLDPEKLKASTDEFLQWTSNLVALSKDFPISKELLNSSDHPDEIWKTKKPDFWNDPAITALVKNDLARLAGIAAMDNASRDELVKIVTGGKDAEVALAAWRALGSDHITPAWPAQSSELTIELKFRQRLAAAFQKLKDPAEAELPFRELAEQAPIRWRRFVENATSESMLEDALNLRDGFTIDAKQLAKLSTVAHYNLQLEILHDATTGGGDKDVRAALAELSTAAARVKDHPETADLPARIALVDLKEPFADRSPGDLFGITFPGATHPAEFRRVEPAGARPFYLCTTDVSVGQFAAVIDAAHAWPEAKRLPWPYEQGKPDNRTGPRTWEWGGTSASPMTVPLLWLTPEESNDYAQVFRAERFNRMALSDRVGGNPGVDHPVQYISAQAALFYAALCDCRLPTSGEWKAAYEAYEQSVPMDKWNLRDQAWETQRKYVAVGGAGRWPDEGIFPVGRIAWAVGRSATSRSSNDGALFFQPVNGSGGVAFHHLVGNVAEFVCDFPQGFELAPNKKTASGIREFIKQASKSLFVIGGSALSPPEVPLDKPQPVAHSDEAYADVGIRLAFTAPSRSLAEKVKWTIGWPPFIWPRAKVAGK